MHLLWLIGGIVWEPEGGEHSRMHRPKFIYVMDARLVFHSNFEPFPADHEAVSTGMLIVIRVNDFLYLSAKGEWLEIPAGVLVNSEAADREQELFHVHPSYLTREVEGDRR